MRNGPPIDASAKAHAFAAPSGTSKGTLVKSGVALMIVFPTLAASGTDRDLALLVMTGLGPVIHACTSNAAEDVDGRGSSASQAAMTR